MAIEGMLKLSEQPPIVVAHSLPDIVGNPKKTIPHETNVPVLSLKNTEKSGGVKKVNLSDTSDSVNIADTSATDCPRYVYPVDLSMNTKYLLDYNTNVPTCIPVDEKKDTVGGKCKSMECTEFGKCMVQKRTAVHHNICKFNNILTENSNVSKLAHVESALQENQEYYSDSDSNSSEHENDPFFSVDDETMLGSFG